MNLQFNVCTYNIGSSANDYFLLCKHLDSSLSFKTEEEEEAFRAKYNETQNRTAELLTNQAEVYCLQEVVEEERPLITSLKAQGFEIVHYNGLPAFDNAIALDKKRFKDITNHSIDVKITKYYSKDVAIASATDNLTGERMTFVSAHSPGFDFTKELTREDTVEGDFYCQAIAKKMSEIGKNSIHIIGADMNANPEKWNPRFHIFSSQGFQLNRTGSSTNVNPRDSMHQAREIDFIFTKTTSSLWKKIKSLFVSTVQCHASIKMAPTIGWNNHDNASDHLPVFITITPQVNFSKIRQLWNSTCRLFSLCFRPRQPQIDLN
jgi:endonuclease/exonuclease/phosphatase family metal-dependent hydrolase